MEIGKYIDCYEDAYGGQEHDTPWSLVKHIEEWAFGVVSSLNWPIWVEATKHDPAYPNDEDCTQVAWFLPRKGRTYIMYCNSVDDEATKKIKELLLRFWAGRADTGFSRYNSNKYDLPDDIGNDATTKEFQRAGGRDWMDAFIKSGEST